MDLKTACLQGEAYDESRDISCQIPPECGYPPHIGAKMKKSAYGLNDAPRRWWQVVDKALLSYGMVPTRADRCTYILYDDNIRKKELVSIPPHCKESSDPAQDALKLLLDPVARNNAQGRKPHGFICLHVDDLFMGGDKMFEEKVLARIRKDFTVGSGDKNDIMFVGQRIRWKTREKTGPYISVDQKLAVDAVEEIKHDKHLKDSIACDPEHDLSNHCTKAVSKDQLACRPDRTRSPHSCQISASHREMRIVGPGKTNGATKPPKQQST